MFEERNSELKNCPFCDNETRITYNTFGEIYMVVCSNKKCGALFSFAGHAGKKATINRFNERKSNEYR